MLTRSSRLWRTSVLPSSQSRKVHSVVRPPVFLWHMNQISDQHFLPRASSRSRGQRVRNPLGWLVVMTQESPHVPGGRGLVPWGEGTHVPVPSAREASNNLALHPRTGPSYKLWPPPAICSAHLSSGSLAPNAPCPPVLCPSAWELFLPHFDLLILFASFTTSSGKPLAFPVSSLPLPRVQHSLCAVIVCLYVGFYIGLGAMRGGQGNHIPDQDLEHSSFRRRLPRVPTGVSLPPQSRHPDFSYQRLVLSIIKSHTDGLT